MKKMPCVFVHTDFSERSKQRSVPCTDAVTPGCEWVLAGEGVATRKWDGTACLIKDGQIYARYDAKQGKTPPPGALPCDAAADPVTGHWPHWVLVTDQPQYKWHRQAFTSRTLADGTYELVGPAVGANKEGFTFHSLVAHGHIHYDDAPRTHSGLKEYLSRLDAEGIVFHHPDGRMAKIRRADFCLAWPVRPLDALVA